MLLLCIVNLRGFSRLNGLGQIGFYREMVIGLFYSFVLLCMDIELCYQGVSGIIVYGGLFKFTLYNLFSSLIFLVLCLIAFYILYKEYNNVTSKQVDLKYKFTQIANQDEIVLFGFGLLGGLLLMFSNNIIVTILSIEIISFSTYVLIGMDRRSQNRLESSVQYFLLSGLFSCLILLGFVLLYYIGGSFNIEDNYLIFKSSYNNIYVILGYLLIILGIFFKISVAPFHKWSPKIYDSVPTVVMLWLSVVIKYIYLIFLFSLILDIVGLCDFSINRDVFINVVMICGVLSLVFGSIMGIVETRIKRLIAWSSIVNVGYLILGVGSFSELGLEVYLFYLIQYILGVFNLMLILIFIGFSRYSKVEYNVMYDSNVRSPIEYISQLRGEFLRNKGLIICFVVSILSLGGIPPFVGFYGKQMVFYSLLDGQYYVWSIISVLVAIISIVYYLRIIKMSLINIDIQSYGLEVNRDVNGIYLERYVGILGYIIGILTVFNLFFVFESDVIIRFIMELVSSLIK